MTGVVLVAFVDTSLKDMTNLEWERKGQKFPTKNAIMGQGGIKKI